MRKILWTIPAIILGLQFTDVALADTVPQGTEMVVRTDYAVNSRNADGRIYTGSIDRDVLDRDGRVVIPRGSQVEMIARRMGTAELSLDLESITANGRRYAVDASPEEFSRGRRESVGGNERTAKYVGGGAVIGSIIGAIAGGGKGAAIGAAAGAASGAGAQMATRGPEVHIPSESVITFRLDRPIHIVNGPDPGYYRDGNHYHHYPEYDRP